MRTMWETEDESKAFGPPIATSDNLTSSLTTSASNPTLVSLVQSIMAEPTANMLPHLADTDDDEAIEAKKNLPAVSSDVNDVSSTHDDEKVYPPDAAASAALEHKLEKTDGFPPEPTGGTDAPDMPPPVSSSLAQFSTQDQLVKTEEDESDLGSGSNLSPPNNTHVNNNNTSFNAEYKSVLQVQQEALLEADNRHQPMSIIHCDIDEMPPSGLMIPQQMLHGFGTLSEENANKFEASSLASLLSTAAAADQHHNLLLNSVDVSCANALLTMAGGSSDGMNSVRKRSSNTSTSSSGGGGGDALNTAGGATTSAPAAVKKPGSKRKNYPCRHGCGIIFKSKNEYWLHNRIHIKIDKALQCPQCSFITEYKHHLEYHMRNHRSEKPFKCPQCDYTCVNKSMLNSHLKSHTDVFLFKCAECTYATKYCHSLKLHLKKYGHKAQPRAPRKSQAAAAAARRSSSASQRNNNAAGGADETAMSFDNDDDDDEMNGGGGGLDEDDDEMMMMMEANGAAENGGMLVNENGGLDEIGSQQQILSQFQQQFGTPSPIRQPPQPPQFIVMPADQQQLLTSPQQAFDAGELIRRHQRLSNGALSTTETSPRTSLSTTTTSTATGLPSLSVMRNGNLASLLNSVNSSNFPNGPQSFHPPSSSALQLPNSLAANLITNRISFSGGSSQQPNFGVLPMQNRQYSSASPMSLGSQLTNSLNSLNALSNSVGQQQSQQRLMNGDHVNNVLMGAPHADTNGPLPPMQLNNPILANALQNVSSKILHSPPQQQQQQQQPPLQLSMLQQKLLKSSPPNSNSSILGPQQLYGLMNGGGGGGAPTKMPTLQQQLQQAAENAAAQQQQQQQQQQVSFMGFGQPNGQPQMMNQFNDFFQQQQFPLPNMHGGDSHINGVSSLQQAAVDLLLNSQQNQQSSNNIAELLQNANLVSRLTAGLNQPQQLPSGGGGNAPTSLLAALSQLLNNKQQLATSLIDVAASASTSITTSTPAITKPSPSTISNMMSLQQGFDLTQAINALATQRQPQIPSPAGNKLATADVVASSPPPHGSFTIHHHAILNENGGTSSSNNTTSKELPSSSSSSCSGTSATTSSTRRRKRKGPAFKIDSELRKRLAQDMETLEEADELRNEVDQKDPNSVAATENSVGGNISTAQCSSSEGGESSGDKHSTIDGGGGQKELMNRKNMLLAQLRTTTTQPVKTADANAPPSSSQRTSAATPPAAASPTNGSTANNVWANSYICTHCNIAFLDLTMYSLHMGNHGLNNPFTCNACGKVTKDKIEFYLHLMCAKRVTAQQLQQQQQQ